MQRFLQNKLKVDELTLSGLDDPADCFCQREKKYSTSEFRVPKLIQSQMDDNAAAFDTTTFGEPMECIEIVSGIL
jgi:hypothetical protein